MAGQSELGRQIIYLVEYLRGLHDGAPEGLASWTRPEPLKVCLGAPFRNGHDMRVAIRRNHESASQRSLIGPTDPERALVPPLLERLKVPVVKSPAVYDPYWVVHRRHAPQIAAIRVPTATERCLCTTKGVLDGAYGRSFGQNDQATSGLGPPRDGMRM